MNIELSILDWIQTLHTPFLDKIMVFITRLGDAGIICCFSSRCITLQYCLEKSCSTDKTIWCEYRCTSSGSKASWLFFSVRTYGSFVCFGNSFVPGRWKKALEICACAGMSDCNIEVISVCTLSDRCSWRNSVRCDFRIFGISQSIEMKMTKDYRPGIIWKSVGISIILHGFYKNSSLRR